MDPDSEMDYSKFKLSKNPEFPDTMRKLEKYYGDGGSTNMVMIEPFGG